MRFPHGDIEALRAGRKHSTRRPKKEGEELWFGDEKSPTAISAALSAFLTSPGVEEWDHEVPEKKFRFTIPTIVTLLNGKLRIVNQVGRWYAIQEGRKTLGRFGLDGITLERLQDMTEEGAKDEGFASVAEFRDYWDMLYRGQPELCWKANPEVWHYIIGEIRWKEQG